MGRWGLLDKFDGPITGRHHMHSRVRKYMHACLEHALKKWVDQKSCPRFKQHACQFALCMFTGTGIELSARTEVDLVCMRAGPRTFRLNYGRTFPHVRLERMPMTAAGPTKHTITTTMRSHSRESA